MEGSANPRGLKKNMKSGISWLTEGASAGPPLDLMLRNLTCMTDPGCSFRQTSCQIIGICQKVKGWRPRLDNPGSDTGADVSHSFDFTKGPLNLFYFSLESRDLNEDKKLR